MFSRNEQRVPLTGAGCFLRTVDRETRAYNDASHLSQLVLSINGRPDPDEVRQFFRKLFQSVPRLSAPIRRPYGLGYPSYCVPLDEPSRGNVIQTHDRPLPDPGVASPVRDRLSTKLNIKQGQLMAVDYVRGDEGSQLALTWAHMLFDGAGIESFVERLADASGQWHRMGRMPEKNFRSDTESSARELVEDLSWSRRLQVTRDWSDWVTSLTDEKPSSLSGPLRETKQDLAVDASVLPSDESDVALQRASELGGHMRPMMFYLAVSMRAHYAVLQERDEGVSELLVPVAVNLREGTPDPIYGTQVSFLWFTAGPEDLETLSGLVDHLKEQRLDLIRDDFHEKTAIALETVKYCPTRLYRRFIRDPFDGEMASFFFSYTGEFLPDVEQFLGEDVELGLHTPAVPPSPGSSLIFSQHRERLTVTHLRQEGLMSSREREVFQYRLREDLLGDAERGGFD